MIVVNPSTNTPEDSWTASATDAAGSRDAGAQGRASRNYTPETKRKHIAFYAMATEGLSFRAAMILDTPSPAIAQSSIALALQHGMHVWRQVEKHGKDGIRSIAEAKALRILLGYKAGRFNGIEHDSLARDGIALMHIAEIRMGIRLRNGDTRREWM
jgi:hypothetical protein